MDFVATTTGRLDSVLASNTSLSRNRVRQAIDLELVTVNGDTILKPAFKVKEGDRIEITVEEVPTEGTAIEPIDLHLPVLYEDDSCMVIDKPAGIAVHPGTGMLPGEPTILHGVAALFMERGVLFSEESVLVHRLDKDTTGCLLLAKTQQAHRELQKQFEERTVSKQYLALVAGIPAAPEAIIDAPVGRNLTDRTKMSVLRTSVSREAKTSYKTLSTAAGVALLLCDLHTGRTHQVRVHLSSIGHPILGDSTYGSPASTKLSKQYGIGSVCLHAWRLAFHSLKGGDVAVVAPLPESLQTAFQAAGVDFSGV